MKLLPAVAVLTLLTAAMASAFRALPAQAETCTEPDNVTYVQGSDHCLAIQTYWAGGNPDTLAVYIHGDVPSGRPVDFVFGIARAVALRGANAVVLIRPGFRGAGRKSSGMPTHSRYAFERYTLPEIESMGDALARLKAHHRAKRLVLMGSSGGALDTAVSAFAALERVRFYRNRRRSRGHPVRQAGIAGAGLKPVPAALGPHTGRA